MKKIKIDASDWTSVDDLYDALLCALGAPSWHGRNLNALFDSILGGGINAVDPPYTIVVSGTKFLDKTIRDHLMTAKSYLAKGRAETHGDFDRDVDATIEVED